MCDLCNFLDDDVMNRLKTSLVVIQMLPQKGFRQRRLSGNIMTLVARYNAIKDTMVDRLEDDYQKTLERFKRDPTTRNELFLRELQRARSQVLINVNEVKKLLTSAEPWLSVMEA
ncbi:hypothetical protein pEaSNUABM38_00133 [Erwinia phage pEa_SNUABM_38]|nr:hypothetical protein pEaSNUABM38_00133 [Erwinia phage pEa_SNUABM_38]